MKRIYDFNRRPTSRNLTIADLRAAKAEGRKLTMSTPADEREIRACVEAGIDILGVWDDRLAMAREVAPHHFLEVGSRWARFDSQQEIMSHAFEMMRQGADLYYTLRSYDVMEALAREGIPVQSHIGLIPTFSHYAGGLRAFGRTAEEAMEIYRTLKRMEDVGVVAVEAECIAEEAMAALSAKTSILTISLGSGGGGDIIMSFVSDICGEESEEAKPPKHAHAFGDLAKLHRQVDAERLAALRAFDAEAKAGNFPYPENNIRMKDGEREKFLEALDKVT